MTKQADITVHLCNVRLAFPNLWTPQKAQNGKGDPAYSASFLMPPDHPDIPKVKAAIQQAADAKWGAKAADTLKGLIAGDKVCLHNGDTKAEYDGYAGNLFVSARGKVRPLVLDADKTPLNEEDGKPYSGCYVNAIVGLWAQQNTHGKRVNAQLQGVQFLADGEAFGGGRVASADEFDAVDNSADGEAPENEAEDPLAGW